MIYSELTQHQIRVNLRVHYNETNVLLSFWISRLEIGRDLLGYTHQSTESVPELPGVVVQSRVDREGDTEKISSFGYHWHYFARTNWQRHQVDVGIR